MEKDSQIDKRLDIRDFFVDQFTDEDVFGDDLFKEKLERVQSEEKGYKKGGKGGYQQVYKEKKDEQIYIEDLKLIKYQVIRM